ncbi:hypothetical protein NGB36_23330 [Streptomyces sp. RB6PN25]|uniref:Uncharacterized protein n=1 Tax=Streptomyces humicola TaxID=2953240 RepID=A0ABT1Q0J9_9ACTN|nr:hypothetical protein [Streptomyces humicola]MCQ4083458.1 hypothetical protein [Streptomyces humicola]
MTASAFDRLAAALDLLDLLDLTPAPAAPKNPTAPDSGLAHPRAAPFLLRRALEDRLDTYHLHPGQEAGPVGLPRRDQSRLARPTARR